ncbi:hypothetical protein AQUCO_00100056v1 [Aquilegia coerulea]|uniref:F-box associated domain-containing protein n=1 Tax=Aquilegia coerulea TaxID=218851 RepID=A0A2G5F8I9_AQUCA|nr:hypothetical protein AQUCO_00100056v1 [Aquilegia coerulea]
MMMKRLNELLLEGSNTTTTIPKAICLKASCDGLLLFQNEYDCTQLYISNPATSLFKPLPPVDCHYIKPFVWALVHDTRIDKYKIFGIRPQFGFFMLTLGLGENTPSCWRFCPTGRYKKEYIFSNVFSQIILFQKNELLWLTTDYLDGDDGYVTNQECYCIYSINVKTTMFSKIKIPLHVWKFEMDELDFRNCKGLHLLSEVKGSLYLTTVSQFELQMLVLRDRVNSVWTKSHAISLHSLSNRPAFLNDFLLDNVCLVAMRDIDPSNLADLVKVVIHHKRQLLLYDLNRQECTEIGFLNKCQKLCRPYLFHSNSLVSFEL